MIVLLDTGLTRLVLAEGETVDLWERGGTQPIQSAVFDSITPMLDIVLTDDMVNVYTLRERSGVQLQMSIVPDFDYVPPTTVGRGFSSGFSSGFG